MIDLAGLWELSDETGEWRCPMRIPGDGITALHEAGLIPDPYWGRNEYDLRWIAERDWTIRRTFVLDRTDVALGLDGIDTVAEVWVNGRLLRHVQNAFWDYHPSARHHRYVPEVFRQGENEIAITFRSAPKEAVRLAAAMPFPVPFIAQNNPIPHGNMLRKPACDWGWDWNIALCPFGVTGGVRLTPKWVPWIDDLFVEQTHESGQVRVVVSAYLHCTTLGEQLPFTVRFGDQEVVGEVTALRYRGRVEVEFEVSDPHLWWPAGLGQQTLHDLEVRSGDAVICRRIGLRTIELVSEPDAAGRSFGFRVNGHMVFARGSNWIPADALAGRITSEKTRALLQSAVDANHNMIRVWGGGRYEPDSFYDACDELGLMVWQDFMFACNLYPSTPDFLAEVDAEVRENVARLNHHACLALWCGDNELIGALNWFPESLKDRDRYLVSYDRLNRTIETALLETAPDANWWPSSPSPGPLSFGDAWHDDGSGDMHFWSVWHEGRDFDHYRDVAPRFCSEFGFQSYPSMEVIRTFADPADCNIASPVMESHQKNAGGNARIAETMFRYFRFPNDFENFVYLSQVQQGLAIKTAVTHWRSLKPHCMGTLYWQLNDTWPVCSWSSLDYGGNWKLLHHMARAFYAPVVVCAVPTPAGIELKVVNDTLVPVTLTVTASAAAMDGAVREIASVTVTVTPDAAMLALTRPLDVLAPDEILAFTWSQDDSPLGSDIFAPKPWKSYDLLPPRITHRVEDTPTGQRITLSTRVLAPFVALEADRPGRFSQNAFALFPRHDATVTFTPADPGPAPRFTIRDLHSATCAPIPPEA